MNKPEPTAPDRDEVNRGSDPVEPNVREARRNHGDVLEKATQEDGEED